jgi:hypothetical protein
MVLRLSVPAASAFRAVAVDLATKVAEYLGRHGHDAPPASPHSANSGGAGAAIDALVAEVAPRGEAGADITFEFHEVDGELRIEARCDGRSSQARHPLPT